MGLRAARLALQPSTGRLKAGIVGPYRRSPSAPEYQPMTLPDWLFYPLAAIFVAVLVFFSSHYWPGRSLEPGPFDGAPKDGVDISGKALGLLQAGPGLVAELVEDKGAPYLHASAGHKPDEGVRSAGIFLVLPSRFGAYYSGKKTVLRFEVRQGDPDPSSDSFIGWYSVGRGNGPHVPCPLTRQWSWCTLHYTPPPTGKGTVVDYLGLWPDAQGLSRTVDIRALHVGLDEPSEQAPAQASRAIEQGPLEQAVH